MRRLLISMMVVTLVICASMPAIACLWDSDTLAMERQRFPDALELITGKFLRHSQEFYQWRVEDRERRLAENPEQLELLDDLAVAYEKLGNHKKAIELMLQAAQISPGRYETHANLGTFYIHDGQLERGLKEIERAIEINPDAHFGREVYQQHLVNYVLSKQVDGVTRLPLDDSDRYGGGFARYILDQVNASGDPQVRSKELKLATKGVLGMMRFGNHDSPILLEALGDLLLEYGYPEDAKQLSARAYLKASYAFKDRSVQLAYRKMAHRSLSLQVDPYARKLDSVIVPAELKIATLEKEFKQELAEASNWIVGVRADELAWITADKNPEVEFARKYYESPEIASPTPPQKPFAYISWLLSTIGIGFLLLVVATVLFVARWLWRKARPYQSPATSD